MILEYCLAHREELDPAMTAEALVSHTRVLETREAPCELSAASLQAVRTSSLLEAVARSGSRALEEGKEARRLTAIHRPSPAEYARLVSKGRLLYEHCMTEVSHACVVGFMQHELKKSRDAERIVLDLLGWMVEQRIELERLVEDEGREVLLRCAHTDYMLDLGVSLLHGLDPGAAAALAEEKTP